MDLLFSRYASPFLLLESLLETNSLSEFINTMIEQNEEEKMWDLYLHTLPIYLYTGKAQSFNEFMESAKNPNQTEKMTNEELEATLNDSKEILNSFNPDE